MHQCGMSPVFCTSSNELIKHLFKRHRHETNFIVHCSSQGCGASFKTYDSFRMHCSRKHVEEDLNEANVAVEDEAMEDQELDTSYIANDFDRKSMDAQYLLKLRAGHSLSQAAIQDIVVSTRSLFSDRFDIIREKMRTALPIEMQNAINFDEIFSDTLFIGLETEYLQDKFFKEHMGYVEPLPVKLGTMKMQVKKTNSIGSLKKKFMVTKFHS